MAKTKQILSDGQPGGWIIDCPACGFAHKFDDRWSFNGDVNKPTFRPSLLLRTKWGPEQKDIRCHSWVTNGKIQFLNDCTHDMAGQEVELPEV